MQLVIALLVLSGYSVDASAHPLMLSFSPNLRHPREETDEYILSHSTAYTGRRIHLSTMGPSHGM